jgi:asparagine synthase (glutamine-hydrolysing)
MCGICGVVYEERGRPVAAETLRAMCHALRFRGPDAEGAYLAPGVGLGHRRLSVIDLSRGGQPMTAPGGQVTISYNGEIYNFLELRKELEAEGVAFQTTCDTEVLLHGYLRWGPDVLRRAVGMFAFALWDARSETLLLARDRLGVKPLYWAPLPEGGLVFGSELSAIHASGLLAPKLNARAVAQYVAAGYVMGEDAILEGVRRLPPATVLTWQRGGGTTSHCYWDLAGLWENRPRDVRELPEVEEEFGGLLRTAVRQRLISDVPLGAFLSGGLDSSTVTALMTRERQMVETFSIGFPEASYSELDYARQAAGALGTRHFDEVVRGDDPELLLEIAGKQDEPFADTSVVPTYVLCRAARRRVTVALSGDGGDELLAGYVTHLANALHRRVRRWPVPLLRAVRRAVGLLPDSRRKVSAVFKAKQFLAGAELDPCDAHASWRTLARAEQVRGLLNPDFDLKGFSLFEPFRRAYHEAPGLNQLDRFLYVDYRTWLPDDILVKADRASMAHGLEVRSPFLDHRLVEFCMGLPPELKLRGRRGKFLLRHFARSLVPRGILTRRKAGFNAPVSHWLAGPWRALARDVFSPPSLQRAEVLNAAAVGQLLDEHLRGRRDHGYLLFALLMLSLWLQRVRPALS